MRMRVSCGLAALTLTGMLAAARPAAAEVVRAGDDHFTLRLEAASSLSPAALWDRLIVPARWWSSDHTYSGDARNLSLDAHAGGLWRESWAGGSVAHGRVLSVQPGKMLRLDAPFGPLQELAVTCIWTITIRPEGEGAVVRFDLVANGSAASGLASIAPAVDFVNSQALKSLVAYVED
ncbi:ATPase [bacterium]|nr:ATPase [bacterium]